MDTLPELLDEILSHLPSDGGRSLQSCSLVSKSWLEPSRRLLFTHISVRVDNHQSWLDNISPTNVGLLRHIRSLEYFQPPLRSNSLGRANFIRLRYGVDFDPRCNLFTLRDYLPAFCQLQTLTLRNMDIGSTISNHMDLFSAFQHSLSSLFLVQTSIKWSTFVTILGYFPYLRHLEIRSSAFEMDDWYTPQLPHPLRGKLFFSVLWSDIKPFVDRLLGLKPEYEELEVFGEYEHRLVTAVESNLKSLKTSGCKLKTPLDLSRCPELRQLEILVMHPREQELVTISSITSTNFQRIIFSPPITTWWDPLTENPCWVQFDDVICELADRLRMSGTKHTLEVKFRTGVVKFDGEEHSEFLPKFKEKGRVKIVSILTGETWEWS